ncbi:MAG TPA: hypothetical protein VGQ46_07305 [Thermoanaerobaculia bacterium]|nr:hypothetical protein [Thermoanaerobaculia bacterium]
MREAEQRASPPLADAESVDPSLAAPFSTSLRTNGDDEAMYEEFRKRFEAATVPVERNRDPKQRDKAFAYALTDKIRLNEIFTIPFSRGDTEESRVPLQLGARQLRHHLLLPTSMCPARAPRRRPL